MPWYDSVESCSALPEAVILRKDLNDIFQACEACLARVRNLEKALQDLVVGQEDVIHMMLASAIAQQPFLMIGAPGVAKTLLAAKFFELLGLRRPVAESDVDDQGGRAYFEYLLHSFSIPEELFGPYDVHAMRGIPEDREKGIRAVDPRMVRINRNMLTGEGVRACFLDEVFKANSAILNTMLSLINERRFFNDSVFQKSDLRVILGASNETPTAKGEVWGHSKIAGEMRAFYDRWTIRVLVLPPTSPLRQTINDTLYPKVHKAGLRQLAYRFHKGEALHETPVACINDLTVLGRCLIALDGQINAYTNRGIHVAASNPVFEECLLNLGRALDQDDKHSLCTVNPRKLLYGEIVARAHAILKNGPKASLSKEHLAVFRYIWDDEQKAGDLAKSVNGLIDYHEPLLA